MKTLREYLASTDTRVCVVDKNLKLAYKIIKILKIYGIPIDIVVKVKTHEHFHTIKLVPSEEEYRVYGDLIMVPESKVDERIVIALGLALSTSRILSIGIDPGRRTGFIIAVNSTLCLWKSFRNIEKLLKLLDKSIDLVTSSSEFSVKKIILRIGSSISKSTLKKVVSIVKKYYSKVDITVELVNEAESALKVNMVKASLDTKLSRDIISACAISMCRGIPLEVKTE